MDLDYIDTLVYANLWEGRCHRLSVLGHAPFWEAPADFDPVLERFIRDVVTGRGPARLDDIPIGEPERWPVP